MDLEILLKRPFRKDDCISYGRFNVRVLGLLFLDCPSPMQAPGSVDEGRDEVIVRLLCLEAEDELTKKEITEEIVNKKVKFDIQTRRFC